VVIVDGWEEVRLGDLGCCLRGVSYDPRNDLSDGDSVTTVRLLRSNNVQQSLLGFDDVQFVSEARVSDEQMLRPGDIVVCMANGSKALVGKSGVFRRVERQRYTFGAFMGCFRTDRSKAAPLFVRYLFLTKAYQDYINNLLAGSAINNLAPSSIESLKFSVPPLEEQAAIAEALSDADAAIEALDALIAKKRDVKQAAMQQLLTGRTRLPGFSDGWSAAPLGTLAKMRSGGTPPTSVSSYYGGDIPWASISDMSSSGKYLSSTERTITEAGLANSPAVVFPRGVLLYAMYASIGECCVSTNPMATSQAILGIECSSRLDVEFLYYMMQYRRAEIARSGQQGTQANLNAQMVRDTVVALPPMDEQEAITGVLSDMDSEIEALVAERDKMRLVKQGMMQELLSGRVRLV
jgi:type I restriction enzyme S subunit